MVTYNKVKDILEKVSLIIEENKIYLTELDAAIGDGDHGLNMSKGFNALKIKIKDLKDDDIGKLLKISGMVLVNTVGGAAGPLYGTAFMKASIAVNKKSEMDINDFINCLNEALNGIEMRGKSKVGEKTMIDTLYPALKKGKELLSINKSNEEILNAMKKSAKEGMENTKDIIATKGRTSYLKERSIGHKDPGAVSMYLILSVIVDEVLNNKGE